MSAEASSYRLAACQFEPVFLDVASNLAQIERLTRTAADRGADLVVFPECCVTGYGGGGLQTEVLARAEPIFPEPGPSVQTMAHLAAESRTHIVFGMAERRGDRYYNSSVLVRPTGAVAGVYHKTHLWSDEARGYAPGDSFDVLSGPAGTVGMMICFDIEFPEVARILALGGADILVAPTASMLPWSEFQHVYARARAMENGIYCAVANCIGRVGADEFFGQSLIVDPFGEVLARAGSEETVLTADIELSRVVQARQELGYLFKRRPQIYRGLVV